jgi:hypothetical protein
MRLRHFDEANSSVELLGITSAEQEKLEIPDLWVFDGSLDEEAPDTLTTEGHVNEHITKPAKGGTVRDPASKSNLIPGW